MQMVIRRGRHLQMMIGRDRSLANSHLEGAGLLQMIIWRGWTLANDHPEGPASCKWSFGGTGFLQMVIRKGRPLAYDDPEGLTVSLTVRYPLFLTTSLREYREWVDGWRGHQ